MTLHRVAHASLVAIVLLVVVNCIPLAGVLWLGWDLSTIVALYWVENGVVGVYAMAKIATAEAVDPDPPAVTINGRRLSDAQMRQPSSARAVLLPFFALHYGGFWFVHGVFVLFALPAMWSEMGAPGGGPSLAAILWAVPFLLLSHGASFLYNWWWGGERLTSSPSREMTAPYARVVVLHLTIVLGAFVVAALGAPIWALVLMVALKTIADLAAHLAERQRAEARATDGGVTLERVAISPGARPRSTRRP